MQCHSTAAAGIDSVAANQLKGWAACFSAPLNDGCCGAGCLSWWATYTVREERELQTLNFCHDAVVDALAVLHCRLSATDLRHTAATLMLGQGIHPKVVQEMLGHSTIAITMDTYSHVMPSLQRKAADKVNQLLGAKTG